MVSRKPIRTRGKLSLSRYFQGLNKGDFVAISREQAVPSNFPKRLQGITGVVEGRKGKVYVIGIKDGDKYKKILVKPIHLKKIKTHKEK